MIVSIIIPTHKRPDALSDLLSDLTMQGFGKENYEVLVIDSEEGCDISHLINAYNKMGLTVSLLITHNVLAEKRNYGAHHANGEFLIFLDDDLRIGAEFITNHVESHVSADLVISGSIGFPIQWCDESNYYRYKDSRHLNENSKRSTAEIESPQNFVAMNFSISAVSYEMIGGFSDRFQKYGGEDVEFGFRACRRGFRHIYKSSAHATHMEIKGNLFYFIKRVYAASFYSSDLLLETVPEIYNIPTFVWTEKSISRNFLDNAIFLAVNVVSKIQLAKFLIQYLGRTDEMRFLHFPILYKILTIMITKLGNTDCKKGKYNDYFAD